MLQNYTQPLSEELANSIELNQIHNRRELL